MRDGGVGLGCGVLPDPNINRATLPQSAAPERRDLWHEPWAFALIIALLSAEWILRRRWGLR